MKEILTQEKNGRTNSQDKGRAKSTSCVESMPPIKRPSVQKCNRNELEDKFHDISQQNLSLKKQNNRLTKELKVLNARRIVNSMTVGDPMPRDESEGRNIVNLHRENKLLEQKLNVLKHQLLSYSKPVSSIQSTFPKKNIRPSTGIPISGTQEMHTHLTHRNQDSTANGKSGIRSFEKYPTPNFIVENVSDKTNLIRLQRANRSMEVELDELRFSVNKANQKLSSLRMEYDHVVQELKIAQSNVKNLEESIMNIRNDVLKSSELTHNNAGIVEKEIDILNEEKRVLKAAHDRLIAKSLEEESTHKYKAEELNRLNTHLEQLKKSLAEEVRFRKALEEEILSSQSRTVTSDERIKTTDSSKSVEEQFSGNAYHLSERRNPMQRNYVDTPQYGFIQNSQKGDWGSPVLDRLFQDVIGIIESHVNEIKKQDPDGILHAINEDDTKSTSRWQKMYEQIYLELEKVRNMLLSQYSINESMKQEMADMNATLELAQRNFDIKRSEYIDELKEKTKHIDILENQLRSIASSGGDLPPNTITSPVVGEFTDITKTKPNGDFALMEMVLRFSKLIFSEEGLRIAESARPILFLSIEFFDFELQTTPLINGPETTFDYSMAYEVLVSNLFIHYIQTDAISVELFQVIGTTYRQLSTGRVSLRKLLLGRPFKNLTGRLEFYPLNAEIHKSALIATLDYNIDVPFNLMKALNAQRRRMLATAYLPGELQDNALYNELYIDIHRCSGLDKLLTTSHRNQTTYVAYQLFDLPVHMTKVVKDNSNPVFNDSRAWTLPLGNSLHDYLKSQELQIFVLEDIKDDVSKRIDFKPEALGFLRIPLFPIAKSQRIRGSFPLLRPDESISEASIDISIRWKYAYVFEDDDLIHEKIASSTKVETKELMAEQIAAPESSTPSLQNTSPYNHQIEEVGDMKEAAQIKEKVQQQKPPERKIEGTRSVPDLVPAKRLQEVLKQLSDSSSDESQMDTHELETRLLHIQSPSISKIDTKADAKLSIQPLPKLRYIPKLVEEVIDGIKPHENMPESNIPEIPAPTQAKENNSNSSDSSVASDATYTTTGTQSKGLEEEILSPPLRTAPRAIDVEPEIEMPADKTPGNVEQEMERMLQLGAEALEMSRSSSASLSPPDVGKTTMQNNRIKSEEDIPQAPVRRSLLGDLPSLQPPIAPARKAGAKAVEFTDPLHSSIPPSEASSFADEQTTNGSVASSSSGTPRQRPIAKRRVMDLTLSDVNRAPPSIRTSNELVDTPEEEDQSQDLRVSIYIGGLRILEGSPLLTSQYDGAQVFVEWNFLDFNRDICETPGTLALPRKSTDICMFDSERLYELNRKRADLLAQWTHLNNRLTFTLVMDPMDDQSLDFDDLCIGELYLNEVIETSDHLMTLRNIDNMPMAMLEVNINYSEKLLEHLRGV